MNLFDRAFAIPRKDVRDNQRSKVYAAERAAFNSHAKANERLETVQDMEEFVEYVWGLKRIQTAFPRATQLWPSSLPDVKDGRRRRAPCANEYYINIPKWGRCKWIVCHELAHTIAERTHRNIAGHGWQYCETYLLVVRYVLGVDAHDLLKRSFRAHRVKFRKPTKRKPLTDEQRAALVARVAKAREARLANRA